jgi:hypothetical protein
MFYSEFRGSGRGGINWYRDLPGHSIRTRNREALDPRAPVGTGDPSINLVRRDHILHLASRAKVTWRTAAPPIRFSASPDVWCSGPFLADVAQAFNGAIVPPR